MQLTCCRPGKLLRWQLVVQSDHQSELPDAKSKQPLASRSCSELKRIQTVSETFHPRAGGTLELRVIRAVYHVLVASMFAVLCSSERGWHCVSADHWHHVRRTTVLHKP
jgi:hypothetical protein